MFHFKALARLIISGQYEPSMIDQFAKKLSQREIDELIKLAKICS